MSTKQKYPLIVVFVVAAMLSSLYFLTREEDSVKSNISGSSDTASSVDGIGSQVTGSTPSTALSVNFTNSDLTKTLVDFDEVLQGASKDGIPAISNPKFDPLFASDTPDETLGILLELDNEKRFYPYNILVSHEIVNDSFGDTNVVVTFCPLCGSAIVFDRTIDGTAVEFGVSGFLYESNLIMYDRTDSPSLWSQARTEAIIGDQIGTKLKLIDFQLLSFGDLKASHADATILSTDTGFSRNYSVDPYPGYSDTDQTIFPVSITDDNRFPAKEVFYIVPLEDGTKSIAIKYRDLDRGGSSTDPVSNLSIAKSGSGELTITDGSGAERHGYYEMWFSWVQHHQDDGQVFTP